MHNLLRRFGNCAAKEVRIFERRWEMKPGKWRKKTPFLCGAFDGNETEWILYAVPSSASPGRRPSLKSAHLSRLPSIILRHFLPLPPVPLVVAPVYGAGVAVVVRGHEGGAGRGGRDGWVLEAGEEGGGGGRAGRDWQGEVGGEDGRVQRWLFLPPEQTEHHFFSADALTGGS